MKLQLRMVGTGTGEAAAPGETYPPLQACRWVYVQQPTKLQLLTSVGNSAPVLRKTSSLTPASSLQRLYQQEGPGGSSHGLGCRDFPSQEPQHNIAHLLWPEPVNTKERAAVTPNAAVTLVFAVGGVSSSCLVSAGRKTRANPTKKLIKPLLGLSAGSQHGWEGSDICRRFYTAGRCLTLSPKKLLKKCVFERAERAEDKSCLTVLITKSTIIQLRSLK